MKILAVNDIPADALGDPVRARRGEYLTVDDDEGAALIESGLAVAHDSADATFFRNALAMLAGKHER